MAGLPVSSMGYDIDRFESPINDGLLCCICRDVLEDPLQAPCEHAFCSTCIRGWLVHEQTCPEDRQLLFESQLRPIFRYMRNDLNQLKIRCINTEAGCGVVCKLERIDAHQEECGFVTIPCTSTGCTATFERRQLEEHLRTCSFRPRECPRGCGLPMLSGDDETHNCIAEMRNAFELMRSEMIGKIEDQKQEMELRLDLQRRHMVQKEGSMKGMVDELKEQVTRCQEQAST